MNMNPMNAVVNPVEQDYLTEMERDILLSAYANRYRGSDLVDCVLTRSTKMNEFRRALAQLVLRNLLSFAGGNTFILTDEGELTATMLMTEVMA